MKLCGLIVGNVSGIAMLATHAIAQIILAAVLITDDGDVRISTDFQAH
ncbi:MAG: hypothetical protein ABSC63_16350 [Candidatus Binataceae bacterium]|jgi:hypothetical protein